MGERLGVALPPDTVDVPSTPLGVRVAGKGEVEGKGERDRVVVERVE